MLTPTQQHRFDLYTELRSLATVAEKKGVSREASRQCLEKIPRDFKEHRKRYMQVYQAKA